MTSRDLTRADLTERLDGSLRAVESLRDMLDAIERINAALIACLEAGGTIYTAGNGGSAAQALHLAEELIGRYRAKRPPLRAVCLNADPTAITCIANDYGYEHIFARQCSALLTERDALVVLSTSGSSPNILEAIGIADERGTTSIGLLGRDGGEAARYCTDAIVVPAEDSAHIQDAHNVLIHLICEALDRRFAPTLIA